MGKSACCDKNGLKKGPWTAEEDQKLMDYIQKHGHGKWRTLPKNAGFFSPLFLAFSVGLETELLSNDGFVFILR